MAAAHWDTVKQAISSPVTHGLSVPICSQELVMSAVTLTSPCFILVFGSPEDLSGVQQIKEAGQIRSSLTCSIHTNYWHIKNKFANLLNELVHILGVLWS